MPFMMTMGPVAQYPQTGKATVCRFVCVKALPATKLGQQQRIPRETVEGGR